MNECVCVCVCISTMKPVGSTVMSEIHSKGSPGRSAHKDNARARQGQWARTSSSLAQIISNEAIMACVSPSRETASVV